MGSFLHDCKKLIMGSINCYPAGMEVFVQGWREMFLRSESIRKRCYSCKDVAVFPLCVLSFISHFLNVHAVKNAARMLFLPKVYSCWRLSCWPLFIPNINIRLMQSKIAAKRFRSDSVGGQIKENTHTAQTSLSEFNHILVCVCPCVCPCFKVVDGGLWRKRGWRKHRIPKGYVGVSVHHPTITGSYPVWHHPLQQSKHNICPY